MAYELIVDDIGQPVPQYLNEASGAFEPIKGANGAYSVKVTNAPTNGVYPVVLRCADNTTVLPVTTSGIPVQVNNLPISIEVSNFPETQVVTLPEALVLNVQVANENLPVTVMNNTLGKEINACTGVVENTQRATSLFVHAKIKSGTGSLQGLKLQAVINDNTLDYLAKTLEVAITEGSSLFVFEGPLPLKMSITPVVSEASTLVVELDVQLV